MVDLIGRFLRRGVFHQAGTKVTATAKDAAESVVQTTSRFATVGRSAAGAVGQVMPTADAVARMASRAADAVSSAGAVEMGKAVTNAVGRGASTIANNAVGAVNTVATISSRAASGWLQKGEIKGERGADLSSYTPQRANRSRSTLRRITILGGIWFAALAALLLVWIYDEYKANDIIGIMEFFVVSTALFAGFFWFYREIRAWRKLAVAEDLQRDLSVECCTEVDEARFRAAMRDLRRVARDTSLIEFIADVDLGADSATLRQELDQIGLRGADANAIEAIRRSTRDIFLLSLLSTNALMETAAFSIRTLGMIRRVAGVYSHRPGQIGTLRLVRHILADIALLPIGMMVAAETVRGAGSAVHRVTQSVGSASTALLPVAPHVAAAGGLVSLGSALVGATAETITPRVADAALAAGRMGHLGLLAVAHVRPVSLSRSRYGMMRYAILKTILGLRKDANRQKKELRA